MVPIYYGIFFNAEKNGIINFAVRWVEPEKIILNELTETHKNKGQLETPNSKSSDGNV